MNLNTVNIRPLACACGQIYDLTGRKCKLYLWRETEIERKSPLVSFRLPRGPYQALGLSGDQQVCPIGDTQTGLRGRDLLSSSYFIYRHESWKSLTHNDVLSDIDNECVE